MNQTYLNSEKKIFVSYRRTDSAGHSGRLFDHLSQYFPAENIFYDVEDIGSGSDWQQVIEQQVNEAEIVLVIMGLQWATVTNTGGSLRLHDENDVVRYEVKTALDRGGRVIPIIVHGATLPAKKDLPDVLQGLLSRNAFIVDDKTFVDDVTRLAHAINKAMQKQEQATIPTSLQLPSNAVLHSWRTKMISELGVLASTPYMALSKQEMGEHPYYTITDHIEYINDYALEGDFLLFTGLRAQVIERKYSVARCVSGKFSIAKGVAALAVDDPDMRFYLYHYLSVIDLRQYMNHVASGSYISSTEFKKIPIALPPEDEFDKFIMGIRRKIGGIAEQKTVLESKILELDEQIPIILMKAFTDGSVE